MSTDVTFDKIRYKNFMSFGNLWTEVPLRQKGTTLVVGENLDEGGSSGSGKTTTVNAIVYALYDCILDPTTSMDALINNINDKKQTLMEVELYFWKGKDYVCVRRFRGAQTGMQLLLNGADVTPASKNRGDDSFDKRVIQTFGFTYALFKQIILFEGGSKPFLSSAVGDQRKLTEELFKITMLTQKAIACKKQAKDTDKQIALHKALIVQQEQQIEAHGKRIVAATDRAVLWDAERNAELQRLQTDIAKLSDIDFDAEEALHAEVAALATEANANQSQISQVTQQIYAKGRETAAGVTELATLTTKQAQRDRDLAKLEAHLKHLADAKCPYCLQDYAEAKIKAENETETLLRLQAEREADQQRIDGLTSSVDLDKQRIAAERADLEKQLQELNSTKVSLANTIHEARSALRYKTLAEGLKAKGSIVSLQEKLVKRSQEGNPHLEALAALQAEPAIVVDRQKLEDLIKLNEHQEFLIKLLTDKNSYIRKHIISQTMPFLNKRIAFYTEKLSLPHVVLFQPDMSCSIQRYGRDLEHGNLSHGEKVRLNLGLCLAFRDVLTYLHSKVNVLFTDEIDGGALGPHEVDLLIGLLKRKAWDDDVSIFFISHRPEFEGRCDRNLVVRKEQGFSVIIQQPDA